MFVTKYNICSSFETYKCFGCLSILNVMATLLQTGLASEKLCETVNWVSWCESVNLDTA